MSIYYARMCNLSEFRKDFSVRFFFSIVELSRNTFESRGFKLSRTITENMGSDFGTTVREEEDISLEDQVVSMKDIF